MNWTDLCGYSNSALPSPGLNSFSVCFQQLFLQIPILAVLAIMSAYYCGKWTAQWRRDTYSIYAINFRIVITICLALLPIFRSYIILTNTTFSSNNMMKDMILESKIDSLYTKDYFVEQSLFKRNLQLNNNDSNLENENNVWPAISTNVQQTQDLYTRTSDKTTSAKPIDYFVAGTEGLAWFIHICFLLSMRIGGGSSSRGPVFVRVLLFLLLGISALLLRSHIIKKSQDDILPHFSLGFSISTVILLTLYCLSLIPGQVSTTRIRRVSRFREVGERTTLLSSPTSSYVTFTEEQDLSYLGIAMEGVTFISKLFFFWVTPLMEKGAKGLLKHTDDLYDLPEHVNTSNIRQKIDKQIKHMYVRENGQRILEDSTSAAIVTSTNKMTLLRLLHKCYGWQFYSVGILKLMADSSGFLSPILLNTFIGFIEDAEEPISRGYFYALLMFLTAVVGAFFNTHFTFWMSIVGLKIRACIITLVYSKVIQSSNTKLYKVFTFGEIINFMSTDADRIVNSCASFHTLWSIPFQLIVTMYLLYWQIGLAFLAGIIFAVILIPINKLIANKIGDLSTKMMARKDQRLRLMGEALRGFKTIKLNVWEDLFIDNIFKFRDQEVKYLRGRKYLDALCVYFWATTPIIIALLTFSTYVLMGNTLDAKTVFTTMALLNMLIGPLNTFPWVLNGLTEAWISIRRVQQLFNVPDVDLQNYYSNLSDDYDILIKKGSFCVDDTKSRKPDRLTSPELENFASPSSQRNVVFEDEVFILKDINLSVNKGQLVGVMGKVGSGKSLLLHAILGEINKLQGDIAIYNINNGIGYVSQTPWLQRGTIRENILFGKTYDRTKYNSILKACALFDDLNNFPNKDMTGVSELGNTLSGGQKTRIALARALYADKDIYLFDDILATLDANVARHVFQHVVLGLLKNKTRLICTHQTKFLVHADFVINMSCVSIINEGNAVEILPDLDDYLLSSASLDATEDTINFDEINEITNDKSETDSLLNEEIAEEGSIKFGVLTTYFNAIGKCLLAAIFLSIFIMQSSKNFTDLWLSYWVAHTNTSDNSNNSAIPIKSLHQFQNIDYDVTTYLKIYGILALVNSFCTLIRAFIFAYGGLQAAIILHKQLLKTVIRSKTTFFDLQPFGRILNRFGSDTYTVDDSLPFIANILCAQSFGLLGTIIVTTYSLPWTVLIVISLIPFYNWIQNQYRLTSRELKRLSSVTLSPLYNHFNETIQGLISIRAFRAVPRFKQDNDMYLEASQKAQFASMAAAQWLSLRLQLIGALLLGAVCLVAVIEHQYDTSNVGLISLAITYILSLSGLLSGVVNAFTETEREMVAVERIKQYLQHVPIESVVGDSPPYAWPIQGVVQFKDVVLKYRDHLPPSLKAISFITRPAEKIGIVGRTGAGKSSIFTSLFRLTEITSGEILIDNVNIQTLQLNALRTRMAIIPQNSFLFNGTVKENIDPLNEYPDTQIYEALEKCSLHGLVARLGGLGATLDENGSNISKGQRQLFCFVRAVLHNAKILCIDEATANVDQETDRAIQSTIKSSFKSATVLIIAHRIRTIMHCDRVIVMGNGEILEFDEPNILLQNSNSHFYSLASQEFCEEE